MAKTEHDPKYNSKIVVVVTDDGEGYTSNREFAEKLKLANYAGREGVNDGDYCVILASFKNKVADEWIYGVKRISDGKEFIIAEGGITVEDLDFKDVFKVGQKIRLHRGWIKKMDGDCFDHSTMAQKYSGKVVTINHIYNSYVEIKEDDREYSWEPEMFDFFGSTSVVDFTNLKPGTKIRLRSDLVTGQRYDLMYTNSMKDLGTVLTVKGTNVTKKGYYVTEDRNENCFTYEMIDSVVTEDVVEDSLYKVGDKVRLKANLVNSNNYGPSRIKYADHCMGKPGDIVTISSIVKDSLEDRYFVKEHDDPQIDYSVEMFEPVVEELKKKDLSDGHAILYKVGDRVVIGAEENGHNFEIGAEVTITELTTSYNAQDDEGRSWRILDEEIKCLASDLHTTIPDTAFEPGDKVRVRMDLIEGEDYHWSDYDEEEHGKPGTVYTFKKYLCLEEGPGQVELDTEENDNRTFALGMLEFVSRPEKKQPNVIFLEPDDPALRIRLGIGTRVIISDHGATFDTNKTKATEFGMTNWVSGTIPKDGDTGTIRNYRWDGNHYFHFRRDSDDYDFVIGVTGFKSFDTYVPFKVGQKVMIDPRLEKGKYYGLHGDNSFKQMGNAGDVVTIREVRPDPDEQHGIIYYVKGCDYYFTSDMLVPHEELPRNPLEDDAIAREEYHNTCSDKTINEYILQGGAAFCKMSVLVTSDSWQTQLRDVCKHPVHLATAKLLKLI